MLEMVKEAEKELLRYPGYSGSYYVKRILKQICGRKVPPADKFNWPNGLLAKALADYYQDHKNSEEARVILDVLKKYYDRWIESVECIIWMMLSAAWH